MGHEISGKLHAIFDTAQVSERFTKREFVLELTDNPKYPQLVQFQLTGDRCGQLDSFKVGEEVTIEFSLRGREWKSPRGETKYFNSLDVWRIDPGRTAASANSSRGARREDPRGGGGRSPAPPAARATAPRDARDDVPPVSDDDRPYGGGARELDDDLPF